MQHNIVPEDLAKKFFAESGLPCIGKAGIREINKLARDIMNPAMSIWGFLFMQTTPEHKPELQEILFSDLTEFMV